MGLDRTLKAASAFLTAIYRDLPGLGTQWRQCPQPFRGFNPDNGERRVA